MTPTSVSAPVAPLAAEAGLPHTYDEAVEYAAQRADDEDLTANEVKAAAGGFNQCIACYFMGFGWEAAACSNEYAGAGACMVLGVGYLAAE